MRAFVLFALLVGLPTTALAVPITYNITFKVDGVEEIDPGVVSDPIYQVGNEYFGSFVIEDDILDTDGINKPGTLYEFVILIEDYAWVMTLPNPVSDFDGFRGPEPDNPDGANLGAPSPGFDVVDGRITNMRGGVFGDADEPFVDFASPPCCSALASNRFRASMDGGPFRSSGRIIGRFDVSRVAEPDAVWLIGVGLLAVAFVFRRSRSNCLEAP